MASKVTPTAPQAPAATAPVATPVAPQAVACPAGVATVKRGRTARATRTNVVTVQATASARGAYVTACLGPQGSATFVANGASAARLAAAVAAGVGGHNAAGVMYPNYGAAKNAAYAPHLWCKACNAAVGAAVAASSSTAS